MLQNCSRKGAKCHTESLTKAVFLIFFAPAALLLRSLSGSVSPCRFTAGCHRCDLVSLLRLCSSDSLPVRIVLVQMLSTNGGRFLCTCKEACSGHMTVPMRKSRMAHNEHSIPTAIQTACVPTGEPLQCHNSHSRLQSANHNIMHCITKNACVFMSRCRLCVRVACVMILSAN